MLFLLGPILQGFLVKSIASFDDTLTRIPIIIHLTRTRKGRIAFSIGTYLALTVVLVFAVFFSSLLNLLPFTRQIVSVLILILAVLVYFEVFGGVPAKKLEESLATHNLPAGRFKKLVVTGFTVSFITLLDDAVILTPLFIENGPARFLAVVGVYLATTLQILAVIYFGEKLAGIKYKKELASGSLIILGFLVFTGVV